jgi:hypothetical protein
LYQVIPGLPFIHAAYNQPAGSDIRKKLLANATTSGKGKNAYSS